MKLYYKPEYLYPKFVTQYIYILYMKQGNNYFVEVFSTCILILYSLGLIFFEVIVYLIVNIQISNG